MASNSGFLNNVNIQDLQYMPGDKIFTFLSPGVYCKSLSGERPLGMQLLGPGYCECHYNKMTSCVPIYILPISVKEFLLFCCCQYYCETLIFLQSRGHKMVYHCFHLYIPGY